MAIEKIVLGCFVLFVFKQLLDTRRKKLLLPPGPKRKPIIGNLLDLPKGEQDWIYWLRHKTLYGELYPFFDRVIGLKDITQDRLAL